MQGTAKMQKEKIIMGRDSAMIATVLDSLPVIGPGEVVVSHPLHQGRPRPHLHKCVV